MKAVNCARLKTRLVKPFDNNSDTAIFTMILAPSYILQTFNCSFKSLSGSHPLILLFHFISDVYSIAAVFFFRSITKTPASEPWSQCCLAQRDRSRWTGYLLNARSGTGRRGRRRTRKETGRTSTWLRNRNDLVLF